jgi:hypothetical protein
VYNKNKSKTKHSQHGEKKRKAPDLGSATTSAATKMSADPSTDDAANAAATPGDQRPKNNPVAGPPAGGAAVEATASPGDKIPKTIQRLVHQQMMQPKQRELHQGTNVKK